MLADEKLYFFKERTTGEVINFAFKVFRKNQKNFWLGLVISVIPFFLAGAGLFMPFFFRIGTGSHNIDATLPALFISMVVYMIGFVVLISYVNGFVISMVQDEGDQRPSYKIAVRFAFKSMLKNIKNLILYIILIFIMSIGVGIFMSVVQIILSVGMVAQSALLIGLGVILYMILNLLSNAYIYGSTLPIFFISMYEKVGFFKALEISFSYMHKKKNFWTTLLSSLFGSILVVIISINVNLPVLIILGVVEYNSGALSSGGDEVLKIIILMYGSFLITAPLSSFIMFFTSAINYFSQKERVIGMGLKKKIEQIGNNPDFDSSKLELDF